MTFTDSELYLILDGVKEEKKKYLDLINHRIFNEDDNLIVNEMDDVMGKINAHFKHKQGTFKAMEILFKGAKNEQK